MGCPSTRARASTTRFPRTWPLRVPWGDIIEGTSASDEEWVAVGERFLPERMDGVPNLLPGEKGAAHAGEAGLGDAFRGVSVAE